MVFCYGLYSLLIIFLIVNFSLIQIDNSNETFISELKWGFNKNVDK